VWSTIVAHSDALAASGELTARRARQQVGWIWAMVRSTLLDRLRTDPAVAALAPEVEAAVRTGSLTPALAATRLLAAFRPAGTAVDV
jgi:LAO/AO transport system kinase